MRAWKCLAVAVFAFCAACASKRESSQVLSTERAAAIAREIREFAATVAQDVTQEGPAAWKRHFADDAAFFMAAEGKLQFADSASAAQGIQNLTRVIKHIELRWENLRIDPLTTQLAVMAASYHENREDNAGRHVSENGYFTGVVEYKDGRWQFRNAHWSVAGPSPSVP